MHGCVMRIWCGGGGKKQWCTTWIGEVGLGHWGRSGLSGEVDVEEGFGMLSGCETEKIFFCSQKGKTF